MIEDIMADADERMKKAIDALRHHLQTIRTGRAQTSLIERIQVEYYGTPTNLRDMAQISVPEGRMLLIQPFDKTAMNAIEKALQTANLGVNPTNDGKVIRLIMQPLTSERRKELAKQVKSHVEECHISLRNVRRDAMTMIKDLVKEKEISEDEQKRAEDKVQQLVDKFVKEADGVGTNKEQEIMEV